MIYLFIFLSLSFRSGYFHEREVFGKQNSLQERCDLCYHVGSLEPQGYHCTAASTLDFVPNTVDLPIPKNLIQHVYVSNTFSEQFGGSDYLSIVVVFFPSSSPRPVRAA